MVGVNEVGIRCKVMPLSEGHGCMMKIMCSIYHDGIKLVVGSLQRS